MHSLGTRKLAGWYLESFTKLVPWILALDHAHTQYKIATCTHSGYEFAFRKASSSFTEFCAGKFTVHKTSTKFSAMEIGQFHEQNTGNAIVKDSAGGATGLMTNPGALRHWMAAIPEVARMVNEFESLKSRIVLMDIAIMNSIKVYRLNFRRSEIFSRYA